MSRLGDFYVDGGASFFRQAQAAAQWDWSAPLVIPSDVDPLGHLKHDGWWMLRAARVPVTRHGFWGYQVPVFEPDAERLWYPYICRKHWHRPPWLLAAGVAL